MVRVCPERDAICPHGEACPYSIDEYTCHPDPPGPGIPERVRLDPEYEGYEEQVIGWASERAPKDWPEYVRTDVALAMDAKLIQAEIVRLLLTAGFEDVAEFIDSDLARASIKDAISIRTSP